MDDPLLSHREPEDEPLSGKLVTFACVASSNGAGVIRLGPRKAGNRRARGKRTARSDDCRRNGNHYPKLPGASPSLRTLPITVAKADGEDAWADLFATLHPAYIPRLPEI